MVAIIDPDNCLFRTLPRAGVLVARQSILLAAMVGFFLSQCFLTPFLDPVSNASEWMSRLNYVLTAAIALCVALDVPGKAVLDGAILYMYVAFFIALDLNLMSAVCMLSPMAWVSVSTASVSQRRSSDTTCVRLHGDRLELHATGCQEYVLRPSFA